MFVIFSSSEKTGSNQCKKAGQSQDVEKNKEIDETPESPDTTRSSSPDCQILPIIIPTEPTESEQNRNRRQKQHPIPVITLTDSTKSTSSPTDSNSDDVTFEWDMLEESERYRNRGNRQPPSIATSHDVTTAAKLVSNSLPQKVSDSRSYTLNPQDIPTVPVPSLGGSRRLSSVLEKNRLNLDIIAASSSRSESPVNVPEVRLNSPDPEILFAKPRATSPKPKDNTSKPSSKPPSIPLLFSPPPLSQPPLSMEDLAELLNDEGDSEKNDKADENATKQTDKTSKSFSVSEKERLTVRKNLLNTVGVSPVKSSEKGPSHQSNDSQRSASQASFLGSKFQEPRYADNYERHPRQRDANAHESARDKSISSPEEVSSQIPIIHNVANKPDERNVPLYQRRPNIQSEGRKDPHPRPENEFMIDNSDYYNMHANQMHWTSPTNDHQFGNTQWNTSSSYGGMTNPPMQPTQHSFPHSSMDSQFRQNQFSSTGLPAGPRPLINPTVRPQEMSHTARPENIREDVPPLIPPGFPPQYRSFQMGQGSYKDPAFSVGRPPEYSHVRPTWEGSANRMGENTYENVIPCGIQVLENSTGTSYPRPNTPCPWGTRDRGVPNRNQGRDGYYDRNRTEVRPSYNRDVRRSDWSRDGHSDRENPNRFPNRDPRVRTEHNAVASQAKETNASARDPRLAKDKHVNVSTKAKDTVHNERDPRKRLVTPNTKTTKEKPKSQKSSEKEKTPLDKLPKDRMQSPLESLYGVIDTKANQNSGLQKFKIPKIKRPEAPQSNRVANETKKVESVSSKPVRVKNSSKKSNKSYSKNKSKDVASAEVSSSSDDKHATENLVHQSNVAKEGKNLSSSLERSDKNKTKIGEADSMTNDSKSSDIAKKSKKDESEADGSKSKEEVTQEWIEALIRKSFEFGEGKKLVEGAKLIQKFGEVLKAKKFKKIKKIIESESESSSDKDETVEAKKSQTKKKRRMIVSDSSDDECLAERLSILTTNIDVERESTGSTVSNSKRLEEKLEASNNSKKLTKDIAKENDDSLETRGEKRVQIDNKNKDVEKKSHKNDRLEDGNKNTNVQSEKQISNSRLEDNEKKQIEDNQDKIDQSTVEKSKDSTESNVIECMDQNNTENIIESSDKDRQSVASNITDSQEISNDKPKAKTKRRNSLEMLQEDIREMFISEGVITATGFRMCRLSKEGPSPSTINSSTSSTNSKKDETLSTAEKKVAESSTETNESVANNAKSKKSLRSRNAEESSKSKAKSKNDAKRTRSLRVKKSVLCSDSEEDQPLALRTEKFLNNADNSTSNQEGDQSEESNDILRRSKRVLCKDIKEPRVLVEKADISKIDSSKVMFDSSSDESFGIDVSELAAAVESSLRPDKQSDQDSMDTVIGLRRRKSAKNAGKRNSKSKRSFALTDDKSEDGMSFTDEESMMSDISISSNATVKRGTSNGAARTTAKEELLSNILVGLVPTEKNTSIDRGSEADFEEDANDPLAIEPSAKKSAKKKKKKSSWQMGIVSTKKRKKRIISGVSSKTAQMNVEETNPETDISTNTVEADPLGSKETAAVETTPEKILGDTYADANINPIVKCEDTKPFINTDCFDIDFKDLDNFLLSESNTSILRDTLTNDSYLSIEESKPLIKMDLDEAKDSNSSDFIAASTSTVASAATASQFLKESSQFIYDEQMLELFCRTDVNLIDYAWGGQDKYKCLLCTFVGKNIVYHYKSTHPGREVLISRFKSTDAQDAILDTERGSTSATRTSQTCKFCCRFCCFVTEGAADMALEAFYEHCTTHTGEYRNHCNNCAYQTVAKASMRTHYYKMCRRDKTFNESASEDIVPKEGGIYGYLCCSCNYVQLKRENVVAHVAFWHREHANTEILKINMSAITVGLISNEQPRESASVNTEEAFVTETKPQIPEFEDIECKDVPLMNMRRPTESESSNTNECILREPKVEENIQIKEEESEERPRLPQGEPEGSVSTGNLSVFVCPPELEDKEIEIQRERQKTMQEIANNIGILLKNSKPGLSIIDKLQDKMRTDTVVSPVPESNASADVSEAKENSSLPFVTSSGSIETEELIIKEDPLSQTSNQEDRLSFTEEQLAGDKSEMPNDEADKVDVKIRDPLAILDPCKDNESDGENSDNEHSAPVFESDSSSEQSDSEQTDVNMLLKETSSINASSSRDPMMTTIQRLAAQLQNVKPLEPMAEPTLDIKTEIKIEPGLSIPKPPDIVPIASVKNLLAKQQNVKGRKETMTAASCKNISSPKNFIRFRRLSGDILSIPMEFLENQEDPQESNTGR